MALEAWQRYRKATPCPNCGGYGGAYKKENRCKGFLREDGKGFYCEEDNGSVALPLFVPLFFYPAAAATAKSSTPLSPSDLSPPPPREDSIPLGRRIAEEVVHYEQQGRWRPAETKHWFVVLESQADGTEQEITRSLRKEVAELYV